MPFRSLAQVKKLYATNPKAARLFAKHTTKRQMARLPKKVKKKKR
jgi:hypothetical protein